MANDFAVEQQKKPSALPYGVVGAAAGAGGGYLISKKVGNYKSHDDIIKEAEDTVKFTENTKEGAPNAELWKEVQEKNNAYKELEAKAAEAAKPQLPETAKERTDYEAAKKAVEDEMKRLQDIENGKVSTSAGANAFPEGKDIKSFDEVLKQKGGYGEVYGKSGSKLSGDVSKDEIKRLYEEQVDALKKAEGKLAAEITPLETSLTNARTRLDSTFSTYTTKTKGMSADEVEAYFQRGTKRTPSEALTMARTFAENQYPDLTTLSKEKIQELGLDKIPDGANPKHYSLHTIKVPGQDGYPVSKNYYVKNSDFNEALEALNNEQFTLREKLADEVFEAGKKQAQLKQSLADIYKDTAEKANMSDIVETGFFGAGAKTTKPDAAEFEKLINQGKGISVTTSKGVTITGFAADIQAMKNIKGTEPLTALSTELQARYAGATNVAEARKMAEARQRIYGDCVRHENNLNKELKELLESNSRIKELTENVANKKAGDPGVKSAREQLAKMFPRLFGKYNTEGVVESTGKTITEADIEKGLIETRDRLKGIYEEAAKKSGVVNEEAKKAAEEAAANGKKDLETSVKNLIEKLGKGKIKPWLAAVIGGVALCAIGLGIGSARKSKEA